MVRLLVTAMELTTPPVPTVAALPAGVSIRREMLGVDAYRALYRQVGGPVHWDARLRMPSAELAVLLELATTHIFVLRVDGESVGFCEFNGVGEREVVLAHFGLVPTVQGRGLGQLLLLTALREMWLLRPERISLSTDTNDHPRAMRTYESVGFRSVSRQWEEFPDDLPAQDD